MARSPNRNQESSRQAESQRAFYRSLAGGAPGSRLDEPAEGVQATIVPAHPWLSIFNSVFYRDVEALEAALPDLEQRFRQSEVHAWTVWVPPWDQEAAPILSSAGHKRDGSPLAMVARLDELDLTPRTEVRVASDLSWRDVAACNDRAHGVLADWTMSSVFETMEDPACRLYGVRGGDEVLSCLIAREEAGDCYFWFVATVPEARGRGLAVEAVRAALRSARERGSTTASLESTSMAESLYHQIGFRSIGRYEMWERRDAQ
jgi:ribosomal protein S18 acetylase RimI-like enzyme